MYFNEIMTKEVARLVGTGNAAIIDVRQVDAYNGWRLGAENRGGHIPGARSLHWKWTAMSWWHDILASKELNPEAELIVYGYNDGESNRVGTKLVEAGFTKISIYKHFVDEWANNETLPMAKLKRFHHLVPPQWLHQLIDGKTPEHHFGKRHVICHSHYRNPDDYKLGHIPGAIALDTLELEKPRMWNRRTPAEIKIALERHGITTDTTVVIYGRYSDPDNRDPFPGSNAGQIGAIRNAFIMMYAGVEDVRVLNGGLMAWEAMGYPTTKDVSEPIPVDDFGSHIPVHPEIAVDMEEAKGLLASPSGELVSIRSWKEFIGEVSGYNYIDIKGRIPGAIFGNCGSDAYHMENFRNPDHTTREYGEIEKNWLESSITPDKRIAFYCGTGWRASEAFFNAYLIGWSKIAVFDGGWMEWSSDPSNPIEKGVPK